MKIAHIISTFPPHVGGMGIVAVNEAKQQTAAGHAVTVFTVRYPATIYNDKQYPFRIIRLKPLVSLGNAGFLPQLFYALKSFDCIHLHYPFYGGAEWVALFCWLQRRPLVITYHMDAEPYGRIKRLIQMVYDWFVPGFIFKQASRIIAVDAGHAAHSRFRRFLTSERLRLVHNGVNTQIFKPSIPDFGALDLEQWGMKKIIVFVGNPIPGKRLDIFLKALKEINDPDVVGLVVGGGYLIESYKKMAEELGILKQVLFVGSLHSRERLAQYYNVAACLAVPSTAESFSLVVIEAMASGCPVVATDLPGVRERIIPGVEGFLVAPGSVDALVAGIQKCLALSPSERTLLVERARQKMEEKFTWQEHAEKVMAVYKEIIP